MDIYSETAIDEVKAMADADELRQVVRDVEKEVNAIWDNDSDSPINDVGEKIRVTEPLLELRRIALNKMFRGTSFEVARFIKVSDYLRNECREMIRRSVNLYRSMLVRGRDMEFDDNLVVAGELVLDTRPGENLILLPGNEYYGTEFNDMMKRIRSVHEYSLRKAYVEHVEVHCNNHNTADSDDNELFDDLEDLCNDKWGTSQGAIFDIKPLEGIAPSHTAYELCTNWGYSIPELLRINMVETKSSVICGHKKQVAPSGIIYQFKRMITQSDEETMWKFLNYKGKEDTLFSKKMNVTHADMYIYSRYEECVLLMINDCPLMEDAYEQSYDGGTPQYINPHGHRNSPVDFMLKIAKLIKEVKGIRNIWCILLTNSNIQNYKKRELEWDNVSVTVRDQLTNLQHDLTTNTKDEFWHKELSDIARERIVYKYKSDDEKKATPTLDDSIAEDDEDDYDDDDIDDPEEEEEEDEEEEDDLNEDMYDNNGHCLLSNNATLDSNVDPNDVAPVRILDYVEDARKRLNDLVGLDDIKEYLNNMVKLTAFNMFKGDRFPQYKTHKVNLHAIFSGPVGVGKTTMAQIYSSMLHDARVLSKGHVVVCDRSTFIGKLWGDEERRVTQVLEKAKGGVLFIDEAYMLASNNPNDPGKLVLPMMLNLLADETQRDIAVVLAGYEKPMESLLSLNQGLSSRFANRFHFKPFTIDQLLEITTIKNAPYGYIFTEEAMEAYRKLVEDAFKSKGSSFSNGRFIANLLEKIYIRHAVRCINKMNIYDEMLVITPEDIPEEYNIEDESSRMGFR